MILVVGAPRAGKTTFANRLGKRLGMTVVHSDDYATHEWSSVPDKLLSLGRGVIIEGVAAARLLTRTVPDRVYWVQSDVDPQPRHRAMARMVTTRVEKFAEQYPERVVRYRVTTDARTRRRRLPPPGPSGIERAYQAQWRGVVARVAAQLEDDFQTLAELAAAEARKTDERSDASFKQWLKVVTKKFREAIEDQPIDRLARQVTTRTVRFADESLQRAIGQHVAIDVTKLGVNKTLVKNTIKANRGALKELGSTFEDALVKQVLIGISKGERTEAIAERITSAIETTRAKASSFAANQVSSIHAKTRKERAQKAGLEKFVWQTVGDHLVRPEHRAREGVVFTYAHGAAGEFPGNVPGWFPCRCYDEPVIE